MHRFAGEPTIEARLGRALREAGDTLAVAETCTGGVASALVTDVPGASEYFDRAFVPYSYDSLRHELGIDREVIDRCGVVSGPVTRQLAQRARDTAGATWGLATTGVAGPSGGTDELPVGTGFVGVAYAGEWGSDRSFAAAERREFDGDRGAIKERLARAALERLFEAVASAGGR